jgi:hypothetical protein
VRVAQVFQKLCRLWAAVTTAATPYMKYQRSVNHFDFFGIDVIGDSANGCWLIEANR